MYVRGRGGGGAVKKGKRFTSDRVFRVPDGGTGEKNWKPWGGVTQGKLERGLNTEGKSFTFKPKNILLSSLMYAVA